MSKIDSQLLILQSLTLGTTEQDVREDFTKPLLELLGYRSGSEHSIEREVALQVSYNKSGSKKTKIEIYPDYVLSVDKTRKWVLDAKKQLNLY